MSVRSHHSLDEKKDHDYAIESIDPARTWDPEAASGGLQRGLKNRHSESLPSSDRKPGCGASDTVHSKVGGAGLNSRV